MKSLFKKYYGRLAKIGILKSVLFSLIVGFGVNFIVAFITLFFKMSVGAVLGISIGACVLTIACCIPLFYFLKFKPTLKGMATILDKQGLDERVITMLELENDDSYIAMRQRENAIAKLDKVNPKSIKFAIPTLAIILIAASITLGVSMTTVTTLSSADVIHTGIVNPSEEEPGDNPDDPQESEKVSILYEAGDHGRVEGVLFQEIVKGGDATEVVAIPDEGYVFSFWTDGTFTAQRRDTNVMVSFSARAIFAKEVQAAPGEGEGDQQGGQGEGQGQPGSGSQGNGAGEGNGGEGGGEGNGADGEGNGGGGAGSSGVSDNNTVIDGNKDYHDEIDYEAMKESIVKDDTLSQEEKDMLLTYLEMLMGDGA